MATLKVRTTPLVELNSMAFRVYDNRVAADPHPFVRIMLNNGNHLDIPTDDGPEILELAEAIANLKDLKNAVLHKAVKTTLMSYLAKYGEIAVMTCFQPKALRLLAVNEKLAEEGQSLIMRELIPTEKVIL